jgi:NADH-quinone oxidoreductase subunit L
MESLIQLFVFLPLFGFLISFFFKNHQEKAISGIAIFTLSLQLAGLLMFTFSWLQSSRNPLFLRSITLYHEENISIFLSFYFDHISAVFGIVGSAITLLVLYFSKYYLHRESGYKRFFNTVMMFYFGYNLAVFSGNFETLFVGWEFLGITSFLLIAFYRERYLPVKNALKTISLYRLGDICLILALWMSHHLWHENISFEKLLDIEAIISHIDEHYIYATFIGFMIFIAAVIKSAQFPFSSWLPRAMEGPTSSSAIFYGSLSVHLGLFLLLRSFPYWQYLEYVRWSVGILGLISSVIASMIAGVQPTVKTQIAYASVSQIGLMFVEVALGWHTLVLVHFAANALLRTYQLLVSPSVLGYLIHDQFFSYTPKLYGTKKSLIYNLSNSLYLLSIKEWNMDTFSYNYFWRPFKWIGKGVNYIKPSFSFIGLTLFFFLGSVFFIYEELLPKQIDDYLHVIFSFIGMLIVLSAFAERGDGNRVWLKIIGSQFYIILSIAFLNDKYEFTEILIYLSGLIFAAIFGYLGLKSLKEKGESTSLDSFHGHIHLYPWHGFWFLVACLAFVGLPFTPTFIGIDLMFTHVDKDEYLLIIFTSISFLFIEISVLRLYSRVFLGPNPKSVHPKSFRSS